MAATPDTKILANIVKHMKASDDDPLTPLIDEYLIKRLKPKYQKDRLQEVTIPVAGRPRPPGRLSPSTICGCERQSALTFLGVEGRKRIDPDTELIFEDGVWRHHKWQTMFLDMERVLGSDRIRVLSIEEPVKIGKLYVAGHLDVHIAIFVNGEWIEIVIDIKGANSYAFENAYRTRRPDPKYVRQLLSYMRAKRCQRGILLYDSKDKNRYYVFSVEFSDTDWKEVRAWCKRVIGQIESRRLPPMHPECDNGTFLYNKCPFRNLCFGKSLKQIERLAFEGFTSVDDLWVKGNKAMKIS